ncbi:MAG TPA: pyridoxal phosphate-dependent aminotransferase [Candidatus Acidoferrales bacterium]|jgi:alanine-synthesizing transaminase|nr:pyridoxal phosphate-dependent aminotransferase [Candidatus Acidoferrales bacterium]
MFASRTNWLLEPNRFALALEAHRRSGKPLLDLTASNPTTCGFEYPSGEILGALADPRALKYSPESKGILSARESVAAYYAGRPGFGVCSGSVDPAQIILTAGTSEAYSYIFRLLCEPGDEILFPAPSYPLLEYLAGLNDVRLVPYSLFYDHGWHVDTGSLRAALTARTRAVLVVHPNNPTGSFIKPAEAAALREICAERKMAIIADEVFLDFAEESKPHASFAFQNEVLSFALSGISKISALPQMKLAWLIANGPENLLRSALDRLEIIADTFLSPGAPVQLALPKLLDLRHAMQRQIQARVKANLAYFDAALAGQKSIARLDREGGWYAVLRVPATQPDEDLAIALLAERGVLVHPGRFFDFPQDGFLVASLISPEQDFRDGIERLVKFIGSRAV